jgi:hypothetical protein
MSEKERRVRAFSKGAVDGARWRGASSTAAMGGGTEREETTRGLTKGPVFRVRVGESVLCVSEQDMDSRKRAEGGEGR